MWNISNIFNVLLSNARPGLFLQTDVLHSESLERRREQIKKDSKELFSHPLTDLPQENLSSDHQEKIDDSKQISSHPLTDFLQENLSSDQVKIDNSNMVNRFQFLCQDKNRQQDVLTPTTYELVSPSSTLLPNTILERGKELTQILVLTLAVVYILYTGWQNIVGSSSQLKSASFKNNQTTAIYRGEKREGSKVIFSTMLFGDDLFVGDRWVVVKNVSVRTAPGEEIPIKRGQIVTITQLLEKDHFLKANVTFDIEKKEYFTGILQEAWEYMVPFRRLSQLYV